VEHDSKGHKVVELRTWIYTEHTRTDFYVIFLTTVGDESALRDIFDQWVQSAKVP
jgi:hypothetical protein